MMNDIRCKNGHQISPIGDNYRMLEGLYERDEIELLGICACGKQFKYEDRVLTIAEHEKFLKEQRKEYIKKMAEGLYNERGDGTNGQFKDLPKIIKTHWEGKARELFDKKDE